VDGLVDAADDSLEKEEHWHEPTCSFLARDVHTGDEVGTEILADMKAGRLLFSHPQTVIDMCELWPDIIGNDCTDSHVNGPLTQVFRSLYRVLREASVRASQSDATDDGKP
jgi:hypothetical protein